MAAYLPLLEHRKKSLNVHRIMAESPAFYVSVISDVFRAASAEAVETTDEGRARASAGYRLLSSFKKLPGETNGVVELDVLRNWIRGVREKAAEVDRVEIVDSYIGHILAHAPKDNADGAWPDRSVRMILEELDSDKVENGLLVERFNMRGVFSKAMFEGGSQERTLASQYRGWSKTAAAWPRTSAALDRIAVGYDQDAEREDIRAQQDKMKY